VIGSILSVQEARKDFNEELSEAAHSLAESKIANR